MLSLVNKILDFEGRAFNKQAWYILIFIKGNMCGSRNQRGTNKRICFTKRLAVGQWTKNVNIGLYGGKQTSRGDEPQESACVLSTTYYGLSIVSGTKSVEAFMECLCEPIWLSQYPIIFIFCALSAYHFNTFPIDEQTCLFWRYFDIRYAVFVRQFIESIQSFV